MARVVCFDAEFEGAPRYELEIESVRYVPPLPKVGAYVAYRHESQEIPFLRSIESWTVQSYFDGRVCLRGNDIDKDKKLCRWCGQKSYFSAHIPGTKTHEFDPIESYDIIIPSERIRKPGRLVWRARLMARHPLSPSYPLVLKAPELVETWTTTSFDGHEIILALFPRARGQGLSRWFPVTLSDAARVGRLIEEIVTRGPPVVEDDPLLVPPSSSPSPETTP